MDYRSIITIEHGKRGGKPCIRGMRITVGDVLGWLAAGMSRGEILAEFPELTDDDITAALEFAQALAVNGKTSVVIQDARSYQIMLDILDKAGTEFIVKKRLTSLDRKEPGVTADNVLSEVRRRLGVRKE